MAKQKKMIEVEALVSLPQFGMRYPGQRAVVEESMITDFVKRNMVAVVQKTESEPDTEPADDTNDAGTEPEPSEPE